MQLLPMKNKEDNCLLFSAAMILDAKPHQVLKYLLHDGNRIPESWASKEMPYKNIGFHIQELIDVLPYFGKAGLVPIEVYPALIPYDGDIAAAEPVFNQYQVISRVHKHMRFQRGLLCRPGHACAWNGIKVFDPQDRIYDFRIEEWQVFHKLI